MARYPEAFDASLIPAAYPNQAVSGVGAGPVTAVAVGLGGLIIIGLGVCNTLWVYGISKDHPKKSVRVTGTIMAGLSALATLTYIIGVPVATIVTASDTHSA